MNIKDKKSVKENTTNKKVAQKQNTTVSRHQPIADSTNSIEYSEKVYAGFLEIKRKLLKIDSQKYYSEKTLERVLFWTGGQSFLTRKLFMLLAENRETFNDKPEEK